MNFVSYYWNILCGKHKKAPFHKLTLKAGFYVVKKDCNLNEIERLGFQYFLTYGSKRVF